MKRLVLLIPYGLNRKYDHEDQVEKVAENSIGSWFECLGWEDRKHEMINFPLELSQSTFPSLILFISNAFHLDF